MMDPRYAGEATGSVSLFRVFSLYHNERTSSAMRVNAVTIALSAGVVLMQSDDLFRLLSSTSPESTFALSCNHTVIGLVSTVDDTSGVSILDMLTESSTSVDGVREISATTVSSLQSSVGDHNNNLIGGIAQSYLWQGMLLFYEQLVKY